MFSKLTDKEKKMYNAMKINLIKKYDETNKDTSVWWNKLETMTMEEQ